MRVIFESALKRWRSLYISYKVLTIICMLTFGAIIFSVFDSGLAIDGTRDIGNLVIIRTIFASIIGFLLENSTKKSIVCNDKVMYFRNTVVGIISIVITIVVIICYI
ncbi:MAG: hypothetical protein ACRDA5_00855 [Clostridium sp.]